MRPSAAEENLPRGVFKALWRKDGCEVLLAITSCGDCLRTVLLRSDVDEEQAVRWLEGILRRDDPPPPPLRLMPPTPPVKAITVTTIDALYCDADPIRALLWRRKKQRMAEQGQRIT